MIRFIESDLSRTGSNFQINQPIKLIKKIF